MRLLTIFSVLIGGVASVLGQTIEVGAPTTGAILYPGKNFTAQIIEPESIEGCIQVGIALGIGICNKNGCPNPANGVGNVLYAGPWNPTPHAPGGFYQNFTLEVPTLLPAGPAIFSLTHLCMLGASEYPFLEFRNVSVTIQ